MNIQLKERQLAVLGELEIKATFKIPESSFVYMKIDVANMTYQPPVENPKPVVVQIPEGKIPVVCLDTGKAQWLGSEEKVAVIVLHAEEITEVKGE